MLVASMKSRNLLRAINHTFTETNHTFTETGFLIATVSSGSHTNCKMKIHCIETALGLYNCRYNIPLFFS